LNNSSSKAIVFQIELTLLNSVIIQVRPVQIFSIESVVNNQADVRLAIMDFDAPLNWLIFAGIIGPTAHSDGHFS
jgi:hypothetical protein